MIQDFVKQVKLSGDLFLSSVNFTDFSFNSTDFSSQIVTIRTIGTISMIGTIRTIRTDMTTKSITTTMTIEYDPKDPEDDWGNDFCDN